MFVLTVHPASGRSSPQALGRIRFHRCSLDLLLELNCAQYSPIIDNHFFFICPGPDLRQCQVIEFIVTLPESTIRFHRTRGARVLGVCVVSAASREHGFRMTEITAGAKKASHDGGKLWDVFAYEASETRA